MNCWTKSFILGVSLNLLFGYLKIGNAQTTKQKADTTRNTIKVDTTSKSIDFINIEEEIELLEINIEAVIEKPRVAILPKRIEPQLGEMKFVDRSFENELKKVPDKPMIIDSRLFTPKKIEDLKQKLLNKKKNLDRNK